MLPEELEDDLKSQGLKIQSFKIDRSPGKSIARLKVKARRGLLEPSDRRLALEVVTFNIPDKEIVSTPTESVRSESMILSWIV